MEENYCQNEANDGNDASNVSYDRECHLVRLRYWCGVDIHQNSEIGEMFTLAPCVCGVMIENPTTLFRPGTARVINQ